MDDKKYRVKDTDTKDFWMPILLSKSFNDYVKNKYSLAMGNMVQADELDKALEELEFNE